MRACVRVRDFPSFSEGLSLRANRTHHQNQYENGFPFLFGGTFIEGVPPLLSLLMQKHFPSFSEGLSLRVLSQFAAIPFLREDFPSFSEGLSLRVLHVQPLMHQCMNFPSFSEGLSLRALRTLPLLFTLLNFPSFSEGLSLRGGGCASSVLRDEISLPFRRDFH